MKTFKRYKYSTLAVMLSSVFAMQSCSIDLVPQDRYGEEVIWSDPTSMELYVNGLYSEIKKFQFGVFPGLGYDNAMDALADGMKFTSNTAGNGTVNTLISNANQFSPASVGLNYWAGGYDRIRRANEFIAGLQSKSVVNDTEKVKLEAEARFIRSYAYFWLAKIHGSVVIMKDIQQYASKDNPRASEQEVYDFIIEDLKFAAENLPRTHFSGRATKGAANALLSRVALFAGSIAKNDLKQFNQDPLTGIPANLASGYFTISAQAAQQVVDLAAEGLYALDADYANIFANKNSKESILRVDFVAPAITHQHDLYFAPPKDDLANTQVFGVPTANLVDAFEMKDGTKFSWDNPAHAADPYANREDRFYATVLYNGAEWKNRTMNTTVDDAQEGFIAFGSLGDPKRTVTGYYTRKFLDSKNLNFIVNKSTQSWHELRYAEVLLNMAEAKAQLNDFSGASAALSQLRVSRKLTAINFNNITQGMVAIEHERKIELAFEGHRFWDLRRWRKAHVVLNGTQMAAHRLSQDGTSLKYEVVSADATNRSFTGKLYYLPIPEGEVQRNNALTQIQGW